MASFVAHLTKITPIDSAVFYVLLYSLMWGYSTPDRATFVKHLSGLSWNVVSWGRGTSPGACIWHFKLW